MRDSVQCGSYNYTTIKPVANHIENKPLVESTTSMGSVKNTETSQKSQKQESSIRSAAKVATPPKPVAFKNDTAKNDTAKNDTAKNDMTKNNTAKNDEPQRQTISALKEKLNKWEPKVVQAIAVKSSSPPEENIQTKETVSALPNESTTTNETASTSSFTNRFKSELDKIKAKLEPESTDESMKKPAVAPKPKVVDTKQQQAPPQQEQEQKLVHRNTNEGLGALRKLRHINKE